MKGILFGKKKKKKRLLGKWKKFDPRENIYLASSANNGTSFSLALVKVYVSARGERGLNRLFLACHNIN